MVAILPDAMLGKAKRFDRNHRDFHDSLSKTRPQTAYYDLVFFAFLNAFIGNATVCTLLEEGKCYDEKDRATGATFANNQFTEPILFFNYCGRNDHTVFRIIVSGLRFLSLGRPPSEKLAFYELVSIFDQSIWLGILLTFVILSVLFKHSQRIRMRDSLLAILKSLVEQGDPISSSILAHKSNRWPAITLLLATIVISNGYKNVNIEKMTLPVKPIPFKELSQLEENNFTVYVRATTHAGIAIQDFYDYFFRHLPDTWWFSLGWKVFFTGPRSTQSDNNTDYDKKLGKAHDLALFYDSELLVYGRTETSVWALNKEFHLKDFSNSTQRLFNLTTVHPRWYELLQGDGNFSLMNAYEEAGKKKEKMAFLLPDAELWPLYYNLSGNYSDVYIGKESWLGQDIGVTPFRWTHPVFLKRLRGITANGVLEFLTEFMVKYLSRLRSGYKGETREEPKASDMKGNIIVVFTLLPVGISVAFLLFCWERQDVFVEAWRELCRLVKACKWKLGEMKRNIALWAKEIECNRCKLVIYKL